jgi:glutamate synthase domain-containing protein 2
MPKKYHIHAETSPPRFVPIEKGTILDWEGGCLRCFKCVKRKCIYGAYNKRTFDTKQLSDTIDNICRNCLRCVQDCPGQIITKTINPEYDEMGDSYWTPDIISRQWYQAETGSIPVSGAGYAGPFSGPGFDDMWTDMSEIVRPTRDGIHGREYINTMVSLGRKNPCVRFDEKGAPILEAPVEVEIPIPILFGLLPFGSLSPSVYLAMAQAAAELGTLVEIPVEVWDDELEPYARHLVPVFSAEDIDSQGSLIERVNVVEIADADGAGEILKKLKEAFPGKAVMVRTPLNEGCPERAERLTNAGVDVIHVYADRNGNVPGENQARFVKDSVRKVHDHLVDRCIRDAVTIVSSGGIAMAEHVAKGIICGADAVAVDIPLLLAVECRICLRCQQGLSCPVEIETIHPRWGKTRIMNLIGAWRNQILEVLGAMGIREIRRLRGEVGRAMFFDDLEEQTFGKLFGKRINPAAPEQG